MKRALLSMKSSAIIVSDILSLKATWWMKSAPSLKCNLEQKEIDCSPESNPTNGYKCSALS